MCCAGTNLTQKSSGQGSCQLARSLPGPAPKVFQVRLPDIFCGSAIHDYTTLAPHCPALLGVVRETSNRKPARSVFFFFFVHSNLFTGCILALIFPWEKRDAAGWR